MMGFGKSIKDGVAVFTWSLYFGALTFVIIDRETYSSLSFGIRLLKWEVVLAMNQHENWSTS